MTLTHIVIGIPHQRLSIKKTILIALNANPTRLLGVDPPSATEWYAAGTCEVPDKFEQSSPDLIKINYKGETLVYIETGDSAVSKVKKFIK